MQRHHHKKLSIIAVAALLMLGTAALVEGQQPSTANMEIVREKIQADKKLFIAQNMQLTESEAAGFWPIYDEFQKGLGKLEARFGKIIEDYARNYENMTDETARKLLDDYLAGRAEHVKLLQSYLPKFRKLLPDRKVFRYYQIENKIDAIVDFALADRIPIIK